MSNNNYDVIIIGGGPAGLTAAIYTARDMYSVCVLEKNICGGLASTTDAVENYPGYPEGINGAELIAKFKAQAEKFAAQVKEFKEVKRIEPKGGKIKVYADGEEFSCYALIVASGSIPAKLNIPGEAELAGKGVSYCATCDGPLYRGKDVAIIGCGNSGLQEGQTLLKYTKSVTFVEFLPEMSADKILQERLKKYQNTKFFLNHKLIAIKGKDKVSSMVIKDRQTNKEKEISIEGLFIYVGYLPNSKFLEGVVELDNLGYIETDSDMQTSTAGIYAAGDIRSKKVRQIDVACGEATVAAISVREYLKEIKPT